MKNNNLKELKNKIKLSNTEKAFYRQKILAFIDQKTPVESPYSKKSNNFYLNFLIKKHFVLTSLIIFSFLSTSLFVSADQADPNDYLYPIKIKVINPTQILFTPTIEKKNNLRIKQIDETLKDFSQTEIKEKIKEEDKIVIINSISINVNKINDEISKEINKKDKSKSLKTANHLKSILSSHNIVLEKIKQSKNEASNEILSLEIDNSLKNTENTIHNLVKEINQENDSQIDQIIKEQKDEIKNTLEKIEDININEIYQDRTTEIISDEKSDFEIKLTEINLNLEKGDQELKNNKKEEAFILYNEANQKLEELKILIDSDKEFDLKIFNKNTKKEKVESKIETEIIDNNMLNI